MIPDEIVRLFPLEVEISEDMIEESKTNDPTKTLGALALSNALDKEFHNKYRIKFMWIKSLGSLMFHNGSKYEHLALKIKDDIDITTVKTNRKLVFEKLL